MVIWNGSSCFYLEGKLQIVVGKRTPQETYLLLSSAVSMENKYVSALTSERKHWLNVVAEKQKVSPLLWRKFSAATPIYSTSATASSCLHAVARALTLLAVPYMLPHFKPERGVSFAPKNYSAHYFSSKSHLNSQKHHVMREFVLAQGWEQCAMAQR